ncbi:MAG: hypothetical protein Q4D41_08140 [Prevotellaceae bacterium]|nr:hypothetical protein [Prevotellaceae bacterium]
MKKVIIILTALLTFTASAKAMSYSQARDQALFLTDKMAYELNLTEEQYEAAYEVNLDYLMSVNTYDDLYGDYWRYRNLDLSYILLDWQYSAFCAANYFYRPLYWSAGIWHFAIYSRYPRRDYFYFGRPSFYATYRGGHGWRSNGGRSWYNGRDFNRGSVNNGYGMKDRFNRGDFNGRRGTVNSVTRGNQDNNRGTINRGNNRGSVNNSRGTIDRNGNNNSVNRNSQFNGSRSNIRSNRESSTRTTARQNTVQNRSRQSSGLTKQSSGISRQSSNSVSRPSSTFTPKSSSNRSSNMRSSSPTRSVNSSKSSPSRSSSVSRGGGSSSRSSSSKGGGGNFGGRR